MKVPCRARLAFLGLVGAILAGLLFSACSMAQAARPHKNDGLVLSVRRQADGKELFRTSVLPTDQLVFEWIHSVEHFAWLEYFDIRADGSLILREMRVQGYGAGIPHSRSTSVTTVDGWIISSAIDELVPAYRWINSHSAVASVTLNGRLLFTGSDFPHHEALELRVDAGRTP
jgi:hypothetical protein